MKKIFSVALVLALALSVVAPVATSAQSTYAFNMNLKMGSRGADVVALQSFLEAKGLLTMPAGVAKGYFGGLTKSAVVAYQISKGVTPTSGYFGPLTRAVANADGAVVVNPTNPTNPTTPVVTSGVEGNLDVRLAAAPANNANVQTQNDVPVYGIEVKARLADVVVQTVDLQISSVVSSSAENPGTLINTIKVWDGSNVLATLPVNTSTFTKDSNGVYYVRLAGLNFLVPKDVTKTLTVSFSTNSIDSDRTVTVDGYNSSSLRAVSGNGISSFYNLDGFTRTHTFKKPGTATLTLSASASPLRSQNFRINADSGVQYASVLTFNVKAETGDAKIENVYASTTWSGAVAPTTLYLYDGSTLLASKNIVTSGTAINFDNLSVVVPKDTIKTLTVKMDMPATTVNGTYASTSVSRVVFEKPNGSTADASGSQVIGVNHYAYTKVAQITLAGTPTITAQNASVSGGTSSVTAVFPLNITALGGNVVMPGNGDFTVTFSNGQTATLANTSVVTIPNNAIADGSSATVTVTAKSAGFAAGLYNAAITSITWNAGNGSTTQTYGLDDFKTSAAANQQ